MPFDQSRNMLASAASPYLKLHSGNPIHWQEWSAELAAYAKANKKPILVSVGYSSCHWCHVMAREAFSNREIADYLNEHFLCVKVDREERPDIDELMMRASIEMTGSGGWPLNVFLSSQLRPFFSLTYAPIEPRYGLPGFLEILRKVREHYEANGGEMERLELAVPRPADAFEHALVPALASRYDWTNDGWGGAPKFPSHCTLLFSLAYFEETRETRLLEMARRALDRMLASGLCDHLQGGFFRYCVDDGWEIPHFEKMLYDQAMHLWNYSIAYRLLGEERYARAARGICQCLEDSFSINGLYASALDADEGEKEGATYLWGYDEMKEALSKEEFALFCKHYAISRKGNFEGKSHITKKTLEGNSALLAVESKLLAIRKARRQPFRDAKAVTSWNCLAGIALVNAYRCLGYEKYLSRAFELFDELLCRNFSGGELLRYSIDGKAHGNAVLEDYAALLLFATYIHEESGGKEALIRSLTDGIERFRVRGHLFESRGRDFLDVEASAFDHPTPSSVSLTELALARASAIL